MQDWVDKARADLAKGLREWFEGKRENHPQGKSGLKYVVTSHMSCNMNDAGEWARHIGMDDDFSVVGGKYRCNPEQ